MDAVQPSLDQLRIFLAVVEEDAAAWFAMGFAFVAIGGDILCLRKSVDALAERFRQVRA